MRGRGKRSAVDSLSKAYFCVADKVKDRFFRADSACYEAAVLQWLADPERADASKSRIGFTISADMTPELHLLCTRVADSEWELVDELVDETVCCMAERLVQLRSSGGGGGATPARLPTSPSRAAPRSLQVARLHSPHDRRRRAFGGESRAGGQRTFAIDAPRPALSSAARRGATHVKNLASGSGPAVRGLTREREPR
jgi:hypothetical protein